jgi:outer membrane protein TolC
MIDAETQLARDRIAVEVRTALTTLQTASERVALVDQQAKLAAQLEDATRRGYDAGDRSLFDVYLREQSRLSAESGRIDALVDRHLAEAELLAVLGQR